MMRRSHSAPEHPPHTSLLVERRQSDEANQSMGMIKRPLWSKAKLGKDKKKNVSFSLKNKKKDTDYKYT